MRLTLRTLLAYLDDILEPAQAKELGAKIAESAYATGLVNRIRDVLRRRRLTTSELDGPQMGLDPNTVAEYLDNTLPADSIADVEKVCLESDINLAEVAACHQILALVMGEPVEIPRDSRSRMYALGPILPDVNSGSASAPQGSGILVKAPAIAPIAGTSPQFRAVPAEAAGQQIGKLETAPDTPARSAAAPAPASAKTSNLSGVTAAPSFEETIPEYLRSKPLWKRAMPYAAVALLVVVWVGLLMLDGSPFATPSGDNAPGTNVAIGDPSAAANVPTADESEKPGEVAPPADGVPAAEAVVASNPIAPSTTGPNQIPIDRPPPDDAEGAVSVVDNRPPAALTLPGGINPASPLPPASTGTTAAPAATLPAVVPVDGDAPVVAPGVNEPPVPSPPPVATRAPEIQYNSIEGIVLRFEPEKQDWMVLRHRGIVRADDRVVVPEPFEALLDIPKPGCRVKLMAGTSVRILPPNEAGAFGFAIRRGRVVLERTSADPEADPARPVSVSIGVNGELWRVELLTADTRCGIEIIPRQPDQLNQDLGKDVYVGGLYVQRGSVRFADGSDKVYLQEAGSWNSLAPADRAVAGVVPPAIPAMPVWLEPNANLLTSIQKRAAAQFEKEFDPVRPLTQNIDPIVKDTNPNLSGLATQCLALVEDYRQMVRALRSEHEDTRLAAITGLRTWLPTAPENGQKLLDELKLTFQPDDVQIANRLLWGFNEADARNMLISNELVLWLDHKEIAIREMAFFHVFRLTGRRNNYRPNLPASQLKPAVLRWVDQVSANGALLPPVKP